jgi:hypothetical protein
LLLPGPCRNPVVNSNLFYMLSFAVSNRKVKLKKTKSKMFFSYQMLFRKS